MTQYTIQCTMAEMTSARNDRSVVEYTTIHYDNWQGSALSEVATVTGRAIENIHKLSNGAVVLVCLCGNYKKTTPNRADSNWNISSRKVSWRSLSPSPSPSLEKMYSKERAKRKRQSQEQAPREGVCANVACRVVAQGRSRTASPPCPSGRRQARSGRPMSSRHGRHLNLANCRKVDGACACVQAR